jgi:hypothetical protein
MAIMLHDLIFHLRAGVARALGIKAREAGAGQWWEVDLVLVVLGGSLALGLWAFTQL